MKRLTLTFILITVVVTFTATLTPARVWYIKVDGTGDAPTLQAGVDSAAACDTVLVAAGTYTWTNQGITGTQADFGMVKFLRKVSGFTFMSESGPGVTVLDAERSGRCMYLQAENTVTIDGFTMKNGDAPVFGDEHGGNIIAHLANPTFKNCIIRNGTAVQGGGLWFGGVSNARFENCQFIGNTATHGGGVLLVNSSLQFLFVDCLFRNNSASGDGGGVFSYNANTKLENCVIAGNTASSEGGGFHGQSTGPVTFANVTVAENDCAIGSGIRLFDGSYMTLTRSIVAFNSQGMAIDLDGTSTIMILCSDVYGNQGGDALPPGSDAGGNLSVDPQFCGSMGTWYYRLQSDSQCLPENHPGGPGCSVIGAFPMGCGSVPAEKASLGRLKALFGK